MTRQRALACCWRRVIAALAGLATAGACAAGREAETGAGAAPASLVPVIGNWSPVNDSGAGLRVDGAQWSGRTEPGAVEPVVRSLFGVAEPAFVTRAVSDGAFPLAVWSDPATFSSGTIRVRFRLEGGASDQNAGVVLGLRPTGEYYFVRYNTKDGDVAVWEYANGERRVLAHGTTHEQLPLGEWHELVVTVDGARVTGAVTGRTPSVEHRLEAPPAGRVGIWTKRDAVTAFRDYRVERRG